jgi:hypothetical protein
MKTLILAVLLTLSLIGCGHADQPNPITQPVIAGSSEDPTGNYPPSTQGLGGGCDMFNPCHNEAPQGPQGPVWVPPQNH